MSPSTQAPRTSSPTLRQGSAGVLRWVIWPLIRHPLLLCQLSSIYRFQGPFSIIVSTYILFHSWDVLLLPSLKYLLFSFSFSYCTFLFTNFASSSACTSNSNSVSFSIVLGLVLLQNYCHIYHPCHQLDYI